MDIKHREVVQWLQEVYGEEKIPPYEKTEHSIDILHQLMTASKHSERNAKVLTMDYAKKAAEYNGEARQLRKWLEPVKIKQSILSKESQKALSALASTAQVLDVQIPTSTNIILAMNQLEMDHMQVVSEREQERGRTYRLLEMSQELSRKLVEMRGILQQAEATWEQQQEEHTKDVKQEEFIRRKHKNYSYDISQYEAKLSQVGLNEKITHSSLAKQWSVLQELEKEVKKLELQLQSYTLPPDITLAKVKVQEARQELADIMDSYATACEQTNVP